MMYKRILILLISTLSYTTIATADKAILAGGCFWCMESDFEKLDGVTEVISGFTGGMLLNPTYSGNHKGHIEAVEIHYDSQKITYAALLDYYWLQIDPFDAQGQFCDKGPSYVSAIFVANQQQQAIAEQSKRNIQAQFPQQKIATAIFNTSIFYPIRGKESYHQNYYKNNPIRYQGYRWNCGRDKRLKAIWGDKTTH